MKNVSKSPQAVENKNRPWNRMLSFFRAFLCFVFCYLIQLDAFIRFTGFKDSIVSLPTYKSVLQAVVVVGILLVLLRRHTIKELLVFALILVPNMMYCGHFKLNTQIPMLNAFLFMVVASEIDLRKLIGADLFALVVLFITCVVLSVQGVIPSNDTTTEYSRHVDEAISTIRHGFGFKHPNTTGLVLALISIYLILYVWGRMKWWHWCVIGCNLYLIYEVVDSRGALLLLSTVVILKVVVTVLPDFFQWLPIRVLTILSPAVLFGGSWYVGKLFLQGHPFALLMNQFTTGRVNLISRALTQYPIKLFGQKMSRELVPVLDNGYISLLYRNGLWISIVYLLGITILMYRLLKRNYKAEVIVGLAFLVYQVFEAFHVVTFNPFLMLMGSVILCQPVEKQCSLVAYVPRVKPKRGLKRGEKPDGKEKR